jgi:hypothetical protein
MEDEGIDEVVEVIAVRAADAGNAQRTVVPAR